MSDARPNERKIKAVLFDYDGVLADTMGDNYRAWQYAFKGCGVSLRRRDYFLLEGYPAIDVVKIMAKKYQLGKGAPLDQVLSKKEEFYQQHHRLVFYRGVLPILRRLKKKRVRLALVSGARQERVRATVPAKFLARFDTVITADGLGRNKPWPDPYRRAVSRLHALPEECVAIENSPVGIHSAKRAGIYCVGVCSTLRRSFLMEADEVVRAFHDLRTSRVLGPLL